MTAREQQRLDAPHEYRRLGAPAGDELEAVIRVAGVPTATVNMVAGNRQWPPGGGPTITFAVPADPA